MIVVSTGCPASIGPEVAVAATISISRQRIVLVGERRTLELAADLVGVNRERLVPYGERRGAGLLEVLQVGPTLKAADRNPKKPTQRAGVAQLEYVNAAYDLVRAEQSAVLVTAAVSKAVIAGCGAPGASVFRGHTEWLQARDGAASSVMCFVAPKLVTGLVTTHLPLAKVPGALTADGVAESTRRLVELLWLLGCPKPKVALCALNPHAGESALLGNEEATAILPGLELARKRLGRRAELVGPIGAETAYRQAHAGYFDGVVAMYHDQATIPLKLVAFGRAVNVTMGLSIIRTSVDHGTGYDIAWRGQADCAGMLAAMRLGVRLLRGRRTAQ